MIPKIYDNKGNYIGKLTDCIKGIVIEERNGLFEAELSYQLFSPNWEYLKRGNIFTAHANDTLLNQKFRIYKVGKTIAGRFTVYAKHISYDMQRDMIDGLDIKNQSCEYCLNMIFRNSKFSQKFIGHSDIISTQDYKIGPTKLLSAIGGTEGSIIDTFGTGAELLRDNEDIYVLNKRGHDNGVTIEYSKNMTGLDITEDEDGLITRIRAIAKYTPEGGEETEIYTYVDSTHILDYETPFTELIDFSDDFEDGEIPTVEKLTKLGESYFKNNECDIFKGNYKVQFVPLSKCVGYENLQDKISLCDTVHIKDYRYGIDDKIKVIKATYDFLTERYESMELGEPRTTLSDIVSNNSNKGEQGPPGPQGPPGADGNIGDFPNSLPSTPILSSKLYGFSNIELSWTYENKVYYNYELYASKTKDFIPNVFDIIHAGQTSSFLFQAKPNETWYFRCCAVNTHGNRTGFSSQVVVTTKKIDDLSNYVDNMAINDALIGTLRLDRGWVGKLSANYLDVKGNFSVTDGNGKRTWDIDSFGNVRGDVTEFSINSVDILEQRKNDGNMISNSRVEYDLEGFEAVGGIISRFQYTPPVIVPPEEDKTTTPSDTNHIEGSMPDNLPTGGNELGEDSTIVTPPNTLPPIMLEDKLRIHFIYTRSTGDCILIQCANKQNILIDAVDNVVYNNREPESAPGIIAYLKEQGVERLDYIICTHFHSDHGALWYMMNEFDVRGAKFIYKPYTDSSMNANEINWKTNTYKANCLSAASSQGMINVIPIEKQRFDIDSNTYFEIYNTSYINYDNYNSSSLVVYLVHGKKKYLLLGDISIDAQEKIYATLPNDVDVIKDAHHGYNTTIVPELIRRCNPKDVIVTRNHPFNTDYYRACNSVGMWQSYMKNIYTLFKTGTHIVLVSDGNNYTLNTSSKFYFENCWLRFNNDNTKWCYFKQGGNYAKDETLVLDGKKYEFNSNGFCTNPYNPK